MKPPWAMFRPNPTVDAPRKITSTIRSAVVAEISWVYRPTRIPASPTYPAKAAGRSSPPATERPWPPSPEEVGSRMRHYELMVILDPDLEERTVAPSLDKFLTVVRDGGGNVEKVDIWGRRRLAYEIGKKSEGIYAVVDLQAEPATVKELDRQLNLNEAVLRTKVIRPDTR